jgi:hypothetical protein
MLMWLMFLNFLLAFVMYSIDLFQLPHKLLSLNPIPGNLSIELYSYKLKVSFLFGAFLMFYQFVIYSMNYIIMSNSSVTFDIYFIILFSIFDMTKYILLKYNINPLFNIIVITLLYFLNIIREFNFSSLAGLLFYYFYFSFFGMIYVCQNNLQLNFPIYTERSKETEMEIFNSKDLNEQPEIYIDINDLVATPKVTKVSKTTNIWMEQQIPETTLPIETTTSSIDEIKKILNTTIVNVEPIYTTITVKPTNLTNIDTHFINKEADTKNVVIPNSEVIIESNNDTIVDMTFNKPSPSPSPRIRINESSLLRTNSDESDDSYEII